MRLQYKTQQHITAARASEIVQLLATTNPDERFFIGYRGGRSKYASEQLDSVCVIVQVLSADAHTGQPTATRLLDLKAMELI